MTRGTAALAGVLVLICGLVAWEWYVHVGEHSIPQPVRQIAAASPSALPSASPVPSPSPAPVVYVPQSAVTATPLHVWPTARPLAAPSATPRPVVRLTPYAAGTPAVSSEPMVAATMEPGAMNAPPVREPADAPPRILSMSISTPVAHGGDIVSGTVETTSNVASVEARIAGYSSSMQKIGVGKFALTYRVPNLPFFLHRTYTIEVIARNTRGDAVTSSLPITIR